MRSQSRRILVIDDKLPSRLARRALLADAGFEVTEAATVTEALAACRAGTPDLVLSDVQLPDGSGYQLCREVRTLLPDLPVILVSAIYRDDASQSAATFAGACALLSDPVPGAELVTTIKRHLTGPGASLR